MFCHPNCFHKSVGAGINLQSLKSAIVNGEVLVCGDGLDICNHEFKKSQIATLPKKNSIAFTADVFALGAILIKKYKATVTISIQGEDTRIFHYFAKCNIEGLDLVYQYPSRLIGLNIDTIAKLAGVKIVSPDAFALLI